jgi:hypothetical protein
MTLEPFTRSLLRLVVYYAVLVAGVLVLERSSPAVREAVTREIPAGLTTRQLRKAVEGGAEPGEEADAAAPGRSNPAVATALAMSGALLLVIPVAWVYMLSKRQRGWDPSVVHTVILLPLVTAGIVTLVRNSLALAFSLAGLAAAVRFRNTLKDTKDAVYVFLALAVGLAAGVQALALGFVVSLLFNGAVLALWALNVGDIYAGEPGPRITREFRVQTPPRVEGILLVQADGPAQARVETTLEAHTKSWTLMGRAPSEGGRATLAYLVRLKKKVQSATLVAAITEQGATAEFQALPV